MKFAFAFMVLSSLAIPSRTFGQTTEPNGYSDFFANSFRSLSIAKALRSGLIH